MSIKKGSTPIVDRYKGSQLVEKVYKGQTKIFDAYTDVFGALPLSFTARVQQALKNYRLYGTSEGAGIETVNFFDPLTSITGSKALLANGSTTSAAFWITTDYIPVNGRTFTLSPVASNSVNASVCAYDSDKNLIKGQAYGTVSDTPYNVTISCDSDVSFIRFCYYAKIVEKSTIMLVEGDVVPTSFIPYGYQIPLTNTSGVTENLFNGVYITNWGILAATGEIKETNGRYAFYIPVKQNTSYTVSRKSQGSSSYFYYGFTTDEPAINEVCTSYGNMGRTSLTFTVTNTTNNYLIIFLGTGTSDEMMLVEGSTAPDHYIPHRYTADYNLYIGSTKLGAEEYVDYESGKVYKMDGGVLSPIDPPSPFPSITAYKGENTLSSTETVGTVTVTGRISELPEP